MSDGSGFQRSRELTEEVREGLRDIRRDVAAIVDAEVRRAANPAKIEALAREAVRREIVAKTPWLITNAIWVGPVTGALLGLALGLSIFASLRVRGGKEPADAPAGVVADVRAGTAAGAAALSDPLAPVHLAARYDSLFGARDSAFLPMLRSLEAATASASVRAAVAAWRRGLMTEAQQERLHSAFVQLTLREIDPAVPLDGGILRSPCRGSSCRALLRMWSDRERRLALPPFHTGATGDSAAIRIAERVLVLARVESRR